MLFGMVEAMCWIGFAAGPLLTSLSVDLLSPGKEIAGLQQTFYVSAGCQLAGVVLLVIFKRESLRTKRPLSVVRARTTTCICACGHLSARWLAR